MVNIMIYLDNAATTKVYEEAVEAMLPYFNNIYSNPSEIYAFATDARKAVNKARKQIAGVINASPEDIYFTSGGTESDNWALFGILDAYKNKGRHIITSGIEHHAILNSCARHEKNGVSVTYVSPDENGIISPETIEKAIKNDTVLISIMAANNEIGTIQNIKKISEVAHRHNIIFHTDAVQAVGHIPIDVNSLGIDMLSASAHKFNGPKGIGFIFIKSGTSHHPFMDGGAQESGMRAGTENVASIVGMATALKKNCHEMKQNQENLLQIAQKFLNVLSNSKLDFVRNGDVDHIPGNVSISFRNASGEMLLHRLDLMGICISTGSACDSKSIQTSHVLKAIHLSDEYARGTIRVSFGKQNTLDEATTIANAIIKILNSRTV